MKKTILIILLSLLCFNMPIGAAEAAPFESVKSKERCPVCGMFVAKYADWVVQIRLKDGKGLFFDGVKDMLAFYFNPEKYGSHDRESIEEIWVKDYYSLEWIEAGKAFFVTGSDIYGPMGHEFIPFSSEKAAESFKNDHKGDSVLPFDKITESMVEALRSGQRMKH